MAEYFKSIFEQLHYYRLEEDGKLFELDLILGQWNDISDYEGFSTAWKTCDEEEIDYFRLFIYVEQSESYFSEHSEEVGITNYKYGENYNFYITEDGVYAIDDESNGYKCSPKIMVPIMRKITEINPDWVELSLANVIDYIENQEGIFLSDMDLYYDENGDVQGLTMDGKQFKLSLKTGELNEVFDDIGVNRNWKKCSIGDDVFDNEDNEILLTVKEYEQLCSLHDYLELTGNYGEYFKYYEKPFGKIYALGEDGTNYICTEDGLKPLEEKIITPDWKQISRFSVYEKVAEYYNHLKELPEKEICLRDLVCFISPFGEVNGITEDGRVYLLSDETGELEQIVNEELLKDSWSYISVPEAMKIQAIYKGNIEYKNYVDYFRNKIVADGITKPDVKFVFFIEELGEEEDGRLLYNIYAIDELNNEYRCTSDSMELLSEPTIHGYWKKVEEFRLLDYLNNL